MKVFDWFLAFVALIFAFRAFFVINGYNNLYFKLNPEYAKAVTKAFGMSLVYTLAALGAIAYRLS